MFNLLPRLAFMLALAMPTCATAQSGFGPAALSDAIDAQIEEFRRAEGIVGLTLAITRDGRLIYSKGFGQARKEDGGTPMRHDLRTRIGSVSKATVSGPSTWQALIENGLDASARLYGSDGILGTKYLPYQRISIDRHQPIRAMAIDPDDKVYTWYENGTVSVGTSFDLDAHLPPRSYRLAEGKVPSDLQAVGIAPDSRVYAYYIDGTMSIGASRHLAYHHEARSVSFPVGPDGDRKSIHDVLDITISKSDSRTYAFYDDGTVSGGTSRNLGQHFAWQRYSTPGEADTRYGIRGMGMSRDGSVYAWASNGKAFSGDRRDLGARRAPYEYSHPFEGQIRNRYRGITVQHVFDHNAGFTRSGDVEAAERTFPFDLVNGEASYDLIHRHFLMTRPLLFDPGARGSYPSNSYSNHGMGLTTLLIEALSGTSYEDYTVNRYLRPMGLKGKVRAQKATPDDKDSYAYERSGNGHVQLPFKASTTGLAAGGWTAAAQGVLAITAELADRHSHAELNRMGFGGSDTGKLSHTGSIGGGYARVNLFPDTYVSASGRDLTGIHIALAANTSNLTDGAGTRASDLMDRIVIAVADANLGADIDFWPQAWD